MVPPTDDGTSIGPKVFSKMFSITEKGTALFNKGLTSAEKSVKNIFEFTKKTYEYTKKTADLQKKSGTYGTGKATDSSFPKLGLAETPRTKPGFVPGGPDATGGVAGAGGISRAGMIGLGAIAVGGAMASMTPSTMSAVTQRMAADTTAGISGMSANSLMKQSNKLVGNGVTGLGSPTQSAMAVMYSGGFTAGSVSSKNIMSSLGGLSALTGGSNEQMATALSQMNGMNFIRMGVRIRDNKGDLKPMSTIINDVWQFMYGGKKVTAEQVAMVYNPGSKANYDVQTISGGDPNLFAAIAQGLIARAKKGTGLSKKDLGSSQQALNLLGVAKDAPVRANFKNNTANNNLLAATQKGLVGGYDAALNTNTALTNGMTDLANAVPQVTDALMKFKGFLQTFPSTGPVGGGISGAVSSAVGFGSNMLMAKMMFGGGGSGLFGGGAAAAGAGAARFAVGGGGIATDLAAGAGSAGIMSRLGSLLNKGGKFGAATGVLGGGSLAAKAGRAGVSVAAYTAMEKAQKWLNSKGKNLPGWLRKASNFAFDLGQGAVTGLAAGGLPGAVAGTAMGGLGATQSLLQGGQGGGAGAGNQPMGTTDSTTGKGNTLSNPLSGPMIIKSDFGYRQDPIAKKNGQKASTKHHNGVDYACALNTPVMAAADGKVITVAFDANGYGNYIVIDHGVIKTLYGHLSTVQVHVGQVVSKGQRIARSGQTGAVTGPHLHFEVRKGAGRASAVDPKPYIQGHKSFLSKVFNKVKSFVANIASSIGSFIGISSQSKQGSILSSNSAAAGNLSGLSSPELSALLSSAQATGGPLSYEDIVKAVGNKAAGFKTGTTDVPFISSLQDKITGKVDYSSGSANSRVNPVSGDKGTMAFGSRVGLIKALYRDGFKPGKQLDTAFAVALAESGGRSMAHNSTGRDDSYGIFQINMKNDDPLSPNMGKNRLKLWHLTSNEQLYNPETNIKAAYSASTKGTWWKHWGSYTSGAFVKYLDDAAKAGHLAGIPSYDVGTTRVPQDQLALVHKDEMIVPANAATKIRSGAKTSTATAGEVNITVDMKVNIANAEPYQAEKLFIEFKEKIAKELRLKGMGTF
jgi:murein DD-endopeptidase MepM/ murein hydrolase activator NlpD